MKNLRIAVLDDSKVILKIVSTVLHLNGFFSVTLFEDPVVLLASSETFDLYLTDIVLPGMTGEQVIAKLREQRNEAIIICMSQFASDKPLSSVLLAGANDYIAKPFNAFALISRIKVNVRSFQLKKRLELLAITDELTNLYNHQYSFDRLNEEISKTKRYGRQLSVLMLDVDDFKRINDTRGHRVWDEAIVSIARTIEEKVLGEISPAGTAVKNF
jgi:two-component system cell cycle response regulator